MNLNDLIKGTKKEKSFIEFILILLCVNVAIEYGEDFLKKFNSNPLFNIIGDFVENRVENSINQTIEDFSDALPDSISNKIDEIKKQLEKEYSNKQDQLATLQQMFYDAVTSSNSNSGNGLVSTTIDNAITRTNNMTTIELNETTLKQSIEALNESLPANQKLTDQQKSDLAQFCKPLITGIDYDGQHIPKLELVQIAGIVGNAWRECNFNPSDVTPSSKDTYRGMIQLSEERFKKYQEYVDFVNKRDNTNRTWQDPELQAQYVLVELFGSDTSYWGGGKEDREAFLKATTADEAIRIFLASTEIGIKYTGQSSAELKAMYPSWDIEAGEQMGNAFYKAFKSLETSIIQNNNLSSSGFFRTYKFTDEELQGLANICVREQGNGNISGILAEASLMANIFELTKNGAYNGKTGAEGLINNVKYSSWWGGTKPKYNNPEVMRTGITPDGENVKATKQEVELVRMVFENGRRTLALPVVEHVSLNSIDYLLVDGEKRDKNNKSNYIPYKTIVVQVPSMRRKMDCCMFSWR